MRLLEIRDDPLAHFLPTKNTPQGTFFCAAPPGLAPELAELFMRPVNSVTSKRRAGSPDNNPSKKPRLEGEDDVERARRAGSIAPSIGMNSDILGRHSVGPDGALDFGDNNAMLDDFQMDVPEFEMGPLELPMERAKSAALSELSRLSTPAPDNTTFHDEGEETYADASCPIAVFDSQPSSQPQGKEPEVDTDTAGKGYSKNTGKALSIIRKELRPVADEGAQEKVLSFRKMSDKVSLEPNSRKPFLTSFRHPVGQPHLSSSSCLCYLPGIASNSHKRHHSKILKFEPKTNFGSVRDTLQWPLHRQHPPVSLLLHPPVNHLRPHLQVCKIDFSVFSIHL